MFAAVREQLDTIFREDPAAKSVIEILICYPGFHAILLHRLAHKFYKWRMTLAARMISQIARLLTGIEIHPGATIGRRFFIDHGMGVVIGETAEIGDDVSILHDVTLGGTGKEWEDRHPKIRYGVMIGAGAKILGNIEVGHCARIAAGSVVTKPVPNNVTVAGVPAKVIGQAGCQEPARTMDQIFHDGI